MSEALNKIFIQLLYFDEYEVINIADRHFLLTYHDPRPYVLKSWHYYRMRPAAEKLENKEDKNE